MAENSAQFSVAGGVQTRRLSRILFWHVGREFGLPFVCSLVIFAALFTLLNVMNELSDLEDAPWHVALRYFLALIPRDLQNVIPFSILLSASFMTLMLGRNNELCAMRAAGLSLAKCAMPVWIIAVCSAVCVALLSEAWVPASLAAAARLKSEYVSGGLSDEPIALANPLQHRDWYAEPYENEKDGVRRDFAHVVIRQFDKQRRVQWLLMADSASYEHKKWVFFDGTRVEFTADEKNSTPGKPVAFKELTLELSERPIDFIGGLSNLEGVSARQAWDMLHRNVTLPPRMVQTLWTAVWYNLTFPLACLVAALFGVSMTIANQRSEVMRGFAGAIGMLVAFYLVGQVLYVMGKNGWVPAFIGGALIHILFVVGGVYIMRKKA